MSFCVYAQTKGGAPLEVRCDEDGIETVPAYLADLIVERVERGDAVAATPAGPVFQPRYEGADAAVLYLVLEVLNEVADPGSIHFYGEVPDWREEIDEMLDALEDDGDEEPVRPGLRLVRGDEASP